MCDYDKAEIAGEIGPTIYVGGDSAFLKDRIYHVNVSREVNRPIRQLFLKEPNGASLEF